MLDRFDEIGMTDEEFESWAQELGPNSRMSRLQKCQHLLASAAKRDQALRRKPKLHHLFFELTNACNEHCLHCGSSCEYSTSDDLLTAGEYEALVDQLAEDFGTASVHLCITGGEPLLRPDFFEIMAHAKSRGFGWGMTTNGTLITSDVACRLYACGMRTVSVSLDGLRESHEWFRRSPGSYERTLAGIRALVAAANGRHVQVTTCVNRRNIHELEQMHEVLKSLGVTSWRVINVEPIGRALQEPDLLLSPEELRRMFDFIVCNHADACVPVCFGCSHYLGIDLERETRGWDFLCNAGIQTASIDAGGDIRACLDIERRPELVQGNVRRDRFSTVWREGFEIFRTDFRKVGKCADCFDYQFCAGDSFHTWDFNAMEPKLCMKGILF